MYGVINRAPAFHTFTVLMPIDLYFVNAGGLHPEGKGS